MYTSLNGTKNLSKVGGRDAFFDEFFSIRTIRTDEDSDQKKLVIEYHLVAARFIKNYYQLSKNMKSQTKHAS